MKKMMTIVVVLVTMGGIVAFATLFYKKTRDINIPLGESSSNAVMNDKKNDPRLIFSSGFEGGVSVESPTIKNGLWIQRIIGTDTSTNFTWPDDLPGGNIGSRIGYQVSKNNNLADFVESRIDSVVGPLSTMTRALYQEVRADDPETALNVRSAYLILNTDSDVLAQLYGRYWVKFQPDLLGIMPKNGWRQLSEWREQNDNYRITFNVRRDGSSTNLTWWALAQIGDHSTDPWNATKVKNIDWYAENEAVSVPIGEWFLVEYFFKHSTGVDGRVRIKVNGTVVVDRTGKNKISKPLNHWTMVSVYTGRESIALGPAYQWIDDVALYSDIP